MRVPAAAFVPVLACALTACDPAGPEAADERPASPAAPGVHPAPPEAAGGWSALAELPQARTEHSAVASDGQVYVFGGEDFNGDSRTFDEAERFDPAAGAWQALPPMPTARHGLGAGVLDDRIVVVGGGPRPGLTYSAVTEAWRP